jgi:hypothetical protein
MLHVRAFVSIQNIKAIYRLVYPETTKESGGFGQKYGRREPAFG